LAISIPQPAERVGLGGGRALPYIVTAGTFVILASLFAVSRSSLFSLRHVDVHANGHRSAAEVRALAGVATGSNVIWLDTSLVEQRLEADPWISSATVTRALPWTIQISVEERTPVAVVDSGATPVLVAADGTRLGPASETDELPAIGLPPAAPATIGLPGEDGAVRAIAAMSPTVRQRVREVEVAVGGTLIVRLRSGSSVDLGSASNLREKARALRRVLAWERTSGTRLGSISRVAPTAPAAIPFG
jgi:cell division protein FtsQ